MARWSWIVLLVLLLSGCATGRSLERKATDDGQSPVTASPLPCLSFKW
jgi:uncharacterized lipoprotein